MISRVAGSCFWLHRYVERTENLARLVRVNRSFVLDVPLADHDRWLPLIIVCGERERFAELVGDAATVPDQAVEDYLVWDVNNPVSLVESVRWARENARTTREVISLEMWETLNDLWNYLKRGSGRRAYRADRDAFYKRVKDQADLFLGLAESTLLDDEPLAFMRLGMWLERAMQTARMLDVKHHMLGPARRGGESPVEVAQWSALLYSCGAAEAYAKRGPRSAAPQGVAIASFLLGEPLLPRSVLGCLDRAAATLTRLREEGESGLGGEAAAHLDALRARLRSRPLEEIVAGGIHAELTHLIDETSVVAGHVERAYFDPDVEAQRALLT